MGRNNDFGYFLAMMTAALWLLMSSLGGQETPKKDQTKVATKSLTVEQEMAAKGIACADCPNIPEDMVRVYSYTLPNNKVVETPNLSYIEFIEEKCGERKERGARLECQQRIATVRRLRPKLADTLDPLYGGVPEFTPAMNAWLVWYSNGAKMNLKMAEDIAVGTKREKFLYEKFHGSGTWPF